MSQLRLPARPSLDGLRKQAKSLLKAIRENSADAIATIAEHHPKPDRFRTLRDAQLVIARQYGFGSWSELCAAAQAALDRARSTAELSDLFADLACLCYTNDENVQRRERAARILAERPEITSVSVFAAAAAFDVNALRIRLDRDPASVSRRGGPRNWPPLMYLAYSRVPEAPPEGDAVDSTRLLLSRGADARFYVDGREGLGGWRWTALTGAIGEGEMGTIHQPPHPRARELAEMLLDAGADPNESQGLYNCHFTPGDEWLELLLARGLTARAPASPDNAAHETTLDFQLGGAVAAGNVERARLLLEHGADAAGRDDRYTHRTYVENAVRGGHGQVLDLLIAHGAPRPELSDRDRFRIAVVGGDHDQARRLAAVDPALPRQPDFLVVLAGHGRHDAARLLLDLGADPNAMSLHGRGALHEAAWSGDRDMLVLLMDHGARLDVRSRAHGGTAVGYAHHAGRVELRDWLLELSDDLLDLIAYAQIDKLEALLSDPDVAKTAKANASRLTGLAKQQGDTAILDLLKRHGIGNIG